MATTPAFPGYTPDAAVLAKLAQLEARIAQLEAALAAYQVGSQQQLVNNPG